MGLNAYGGPASLDRAMTMASAQGLLHVERLGIDGWSGILTLIRSNVLAQKPLNISWSTRHES